MYRVIQTLLVAAILFFAAGGSAAQTLLVEVIPLRHRTAQDVIPIVQPMLTRDGSVSGYQGQLIVRTTPANLEEIRRILASIDTPGRQLMITVEQGADSETARREAEISGSVGGDRGRIVIPPASRRTDGGSVGVQGRDAQVQARVQDSRSSASDRSTQMVRVMEGREAFIQVGVSVPVRERQVRRTVVGGQVVEQIVGGTQYRDVTTGFHVLPRVSGDRVTLDIRPQRESLSAQVPGGVNVQSMVTTVSGRLGEWIEIGGIGQDSHGQQTVLLGRGDSLARDSRRVRVRVEEVR